MKNRDFLMLVLLAFTTITYAQKEKLVGHWLITKVEVNGEIQNPYQIMDYSQDGKMVIMGIEVGTWEYNKNNHSIITKSEFDKDFNGENKIINLSETALEVLKDDAKVFYQKVDLNKVIEENADSGLIGTWRLINNDSESVQILDFKAPDEFVLIDKGFGMQSQSKGTWMFSKKDKTVIMIGFSMEHLKGVNNVNTISNSEISLENNGTISTFKKEENNTASIEKLNFNEAEFYNEDGDYKYYEDEEKLPWRNWSELKMGILDIHQLVYKYSKLINGTTSFENKILTANVRATLEEEMFTIDNIFIGFDNYNVPEDAEFYSNEFDGYYKLYPIEGDTFRVKGEETITTPAGTFNCTVVEVVNGDIRQKLWMINDKLGVYAKIIDEDPDETFGHYYIYELQEIK